MRARSLPRRAWSRLTPALLLLGACPHRRASKRAGLYPAARRPDRRPACPAFRDRPWHRAARTAAAFRACDDDGGRGQGRGAQHRKRAARCLRRTDPGSGRGRADPRLPGHLSGPDELLHQPRSHAERWRGGGLEQRGLPDRKFHHPTDGRCHPRRSFPCHRNRGRSERLSGRHERRWFDRILHAAAAGLGHSQYRRMDLPCGLKRGGAAADLHPQPVGR